MPIFETEVAHGYENVILERHRGDKGHIGGYWKCYRCAHCRRQLKSSMVDQHILRYCYYCGERLVG